MERPSEHPQQATPRSKGGGNSQRVVRAVVFDYGGVLTTPVRDSIASWLAADGIRPQAFSTALKAWLSRAAPIGTPIHRLETGEITGAAFERLLAAELTTHDGSPVVAEGLLSRLFRDLQPDEAMIELVRDLRAEGLRTVLLSNSWGNTYPMEMIGGLFDAVVISSEVGLRKPDPQIYRLALEKVGLAPAEAVFVDDAVPNVEGAEAVGMQGIHHTDPITTRARLYALPGIATNVARASAPKGVTNGFRF